MENHETRLVKDVLHVILKDFGVQVPEDYCDILKDSLKPYKDDFKILILDMKNIPYADSKMLGCYVNLYKSLINSEKEMICINVHQQVLRIFQITNITDIMIVKNEDDSKEIIQKYSL